MKKVDLKDTTFCILIRIDSIKRLENVVLVSNFLVKYFSTNITVREADSYNNKILEKLLNKNINYEFVEDKDPILHKTAHFNRMIHSINTPYVSIWDADVIPFKESIKECIEKLRTKDADYSYPYDGNFYNVTGALRSLFINKKSHKLLLKHQNKMNLMYGPIFYGGAIILSKKAFVLSGGENEKHYGWSNDDSDRYERLKSLHFKMYRYNLPLFHLSHPRGDNSMFHSKHFKRLSIHEYASLKKSSHKEVKKYIEQMSYDGTKIN